MNMNMKMLIIIVDVRFRDDVETILEKHEVNGFSEIPMVLGEGLSGKRLNSRLHPDTNSIIFSIVEESKVSSIRQDLQSQCTENREDGVCASRVHLAVVNVEEFV